MIFFRKNKKHTYFPVAFVLVGVLIMGQSALAVEKTRPLASDSRIHAVAFQRNNVVPIDASTFTTTQIVFGAGEAIHNIQNGDVDAWTVNVQKGLPNMLFLKPTIAGSHTNMTVVTNRHTYYFDLTSHAYPANQLDKSTYAIHFSYPQETRATLLAALKYNREQQRAILNAKKNPRQYHWDYSFSGSRAIMPVHVFDDGRLTYLQLQAGQSVPAVFSVDNPKGQEAIVNYRRDGQYLIVQQIAPQFTLRDGKHHVASIFNNALIHKKLTDKRG